MLNKLLVVLMTGIFVLGIGKLSFAVMCADHSSHQHMAQAGSDKQPAGVAGQTAPNETVNAGNKICPVSGERIDEKLKATYEYEGKVYNFCCASCIEEFKKDPGKYIKKVGEELNSQEKEKAQDKGQPTPQTQMPAGVHSHEGR